ncbi:histidine phosphatase family protein [Thiorhodococcus mannitoliphagus]|uniref:Histidine phosphatase family protein n=1 Tax=Thiorhodococcus mannitoliphagus TaxID=329406 RepID=A0A6P1DV75_9GAMM|nr:histidine phosphatase family protein [Thiorhodococcus mannitoliphagus]
MTDRYLDLLRHGEVAGGACFRGRSDDPLSNLGWAQMSQAVADAPTWTGIVSSPLTRCAAFGQCFADTHGMPLEQMDALRERDFGAWEGVPAHEIATEDLTRFWEDPAGFTPPEAEPFDAFRARVLDGWRQILERTDPHSLVITHGGVIRVILAELLQMPTSSLLLIEVPHACRTRIRIPAPSGRPSLVFHRRN